MNLKQPNKLTEVKRDEWGDGDYKNRVRVFRNKKFLVQEFEEEGCIRISVNKSTMMPDDQWDEGVTWDELQSIKREIGYGDRYAVEVYPRDRDIVNIANIRHLWVLPEPLNIGWVQNRG